MAPTRKSRRAAASKPVSYVAKDDSSDDEAEEPGLKGAKAVLKQMMDQDSDAESDFEAEILKENKNPELSSEDDEDGISSEESETAKKETLVSKLITKKKGKSPGIKSSGMKGKGTLGLSGLRGLSSALMTSAAGKKGSLAGLKNQLKTAAALNNASNGPVETSRLGGGASLNLSDSESSEDEAGQANKQSQSSKGATRIDFRSSSLEEEKDVGEENEEDNTHSSQTLIALAQNINKLQNTWSEKGPVDSFVTPEKKGKRTKGVKVKNSTINDDDSYMDSITKLLVKGENVDDYSDYDEDPAKEDTKTEVNREQSGKPATEAIQINIALPDKFRKKKKKGFDVAAFLKRELAKARRETQALLHQAHFVCLVAHLRYLNSVLTDELLYGSALSILPPVHHNAPQDLTLLKLNSLVKWFRDFIPVNKTSFETTTSQPLRPRLSRVLETYLAMDNLELVTMFVLVCRASGLDTRIVLNFDITPLKPPADASEQIIAKKIDKVEKHSPKKKVRVVASDSEGDEAADFEKPRSSSLSSKLAASKRKSMESSASEASQSSRASSKGKSEGVGSRSKGKSSDKKSKSSKESSSSAKAKSAESPKGSACNAKRKSTESSKESSDIVKRKSAGSSRESSSNAKRKSTDSSKECSSNSKRKSSESLSLKLAEASKRKSTRNIKSPLTCSANDREDAMIKNLDRKFPTKQEEKKDILSPSKKRKSEDDDPVAGPSRPKPKSQKTSKTIDRTLNYWAEVYLAKEKKWVSVDLVNGRINAPTEIESRLPKPIFYIIAINNMGDMKDVTKRYVANFMTSTRKIRFDDTWINTTVSKFNKHLGDKDSKEDLELVKKSEEAPMPTTVSGFKSHPLYVLKRHLLKFEAIYPVDAPPIGWLKSEPVYARECVHTLQGRTSWLKEGRCVRIGEDPYKIVKARPKWDKMSGSLTKDEPLEVFGHWQTELYVPPPAVDGKVPRNEFGNVELFKPWMLPKGCVHIPINGMSRVLRKLNVDAAPAMVGWDFSGRGCHPVFDGYVVCEEFSDLVMDAWNQEQQIKIDKETEKKEKRVLDNWRRIIKGLLIKQRIQAKYMKNDH